MRSLFDCQPQPFLQISLSVLDAQRAICQKFSHPCSLDRFQTSSFVCTVIPSFLRCFGISTMCVRSCLHAANEFQSERSFYFKGLLTKCAKQNPKCFMKSKCFLYRYKSSLNKFPNFREKDETKKCKSFEDFSETKKCVSVFSIRTPFEISS